METHLASAVHDLSVRGLVKAARWATEALCGLDIEVEPTAPAPMGLATLRAKAYFDNREYSRCWYFLNTQSGLDTVGIFLKYYSRYLAGEIEKENQDDGTFKTGASGTQNPYLVELLQDLGSTTDPFLLYLKGVILRRLKDDVLAAETLLQSLRIYDTNWSAWQELLACFGKAPEFTKCVVSLEGTVNEWMLKCFTVFGNQEFFLPGSRSAELLDELKTKFPSFAFVDIQRALVCIHNLEYDEADAIFSDVLERDPFRLDDLDHYSNMLYVTEQPGKLSHLAYQVAKTDKFRAEACFVIANYYSLNGKHERAVTYYQRALISNRQHLPSWTLLGHEFVELKNTHSAIECYRTAVDINKRDFRAWYGLGQAYEVLDLYQYAQHYYQNALGLHPGDIRMWAALGNCCEKLEQHEKAIAIYEQALRIAAADSFLSYKLGILYELIGDSKQAVKCMQACVGDFGAKDSEQAEADMDLDDDEWVGHAHLWLARRALRNSEWENAHRHASAAEGNVQLLEDARAIVRDAASRLRVRAD